MQLSAGPCLLRPFTFADRDGLAAIADDIRIARNMTDDFAHPYTAAAADQWIGLCVLQEPPLRHLAIEVGGALAGGIGLEPGSGVKRHVAAIGYWLEPGLWGRGIATAACRAFVDYAFANFPVARLEAMVFGWNPASARVLVKCGFAEEGRRRGAIIRFGEVTDELVFGLLRMDYLAQSA